MPKKLIAPLFIVTLLSIANQTILHGMDSPKDFFEDIRRLPSELQENILLSHDAITFLGQQTATLTGHSDSIQSIAISDNKIATRSGDRVVKIWDTHGRCLRTFTKYNDWEYDKHIYSVSIHGNKIATGHAKKTVNIRDISADEYLLTFVEPEPIKEKCHDSRITKLIINDDTLITGSDGIVKIWDLNTHECTCTITSTTNSCLNQLATNGNKIVTGCSDGIVKIWNYAGTCIHSLEEFKGKVCGVTSGAINKDKVAAISFNGTLKIWDISTGSCVLTREILKDQPNKHRSLAMNDDKIITGSEDGTAEIRDITTGKLLHFLAGPNKHTDVVRSVAIHDTIAITGSIDKTAKIWPLLINLKGKSDDNPLLWIIHKSDLPQFNFITRAHTATVDEQEFIMTFPSEDAKVFLSLPAHVKQYLLMRLKIRRPEIQKDAQ